MLTKDQIELIETLAGLTTSNKIVWSKYLTPTMFFYRKLDKMYIINNYKTSTGGGNELYDCYSLTVIDNQGRPLQNCIGCNDTQFMADYNEIGKLYKAMMVQYSLSHKDDRETKNLITELCE